MTTWLHRVVVNACLDRLRAQKVRAAQPLPDDVDEHAARGSLLTAAAEPDPADVAVADERRTAVLAALARLAPDQRAALVLVDMEGYSVAEAAEMLGCPEGTVKSRCSRGRARLAPMLGVLRRPEEPGNPDRGEPVRSVEHRPDAPRGPPPRRDA